MIHRDIVLFPIHFEGKGDKSADGLTAEFSTL